MNEKREPCQLKQDTPANNNIVFEYDNSFDVFQAKPIKNQKDDSIRNKLPSSFQNPKRLEKEYSGKKLSYSVLKETEKDYEKIKESSDNNDN